MRSESCEEDGKFAQIVEFSGLAVSLYKKYVNHFLTKMHSWNAKFACLTLWLLVNDAINIVFEQRVSIT